MAVAVTSRDSYTRRAEHPTHKEESRRRDMQQPIYLDYQATTPLDPRALDAMLPFLTDSFGNPSSVHSFGLDAATAVDQARSQVAAAIGAERREIIFTSGATEANNLALKGLAAGVLERRRLITFATEHQAILAPLEKLARDGLEATVLPVDSEGLPDLDLLAETVDERTLLVSVAAANSEVGTLPPLRAIADICHACGAVLHTDAAQAVGKVPLDVDRDGIDLLSVSAHKLYGPKGIGALYVRQQHRFRLRPLLDGGGQEQGLRSGTLNVPAIVGFGAAAELARKEQPREAPRLAGLRDRLRNALTRELDDVATNGPDERLPGNLNLRFVGVDSEALIANCPDIAFSAGSACSAGTPEPSHVLLALGLSDEAASESARFSVGRQTTTNDIDRASRQIVQAVPRIRSALRATVGMSR
jgi:cysteine desulfurase